MFTPIFDDLRKKFSEIAEQEGLTESDVSVTARQLTAHEAIGETERKDYPLLQGKESLMQAEFKGALGQAFTDMPMNFKGKIKDVTQLELKSNGERALFIATLNAVLRYLGKVEGTVHCKNREPEECSQQIVETVTQEFGTDIIVGIIGFQPAIIDHFTRKITAEKVNVVDLDKDNIGKEKYGVTIWDGNTMGEEIFKKSDVLLATGSTIVNDSLKTLIAYSEKYRKPLFFFGTTVAGAAELLNLQRLCFKCA